MIELKMGSVISGTQSEASDIKASVIPSPKGYGREDAHARRLRRTDYQARLGVKLDNIRRKVLDNNLRLSSHPTDMLRIAVKRDERSHDLISRTIESAEIMPIILPKMEDIPLRHLIRDGQDILIPSLFPVTQQEYFELYSPVECDLKEDDLLVRILYDSSPSINEPYVLVFQVKEVLATFGYSSIEWKKFWATLYDEKLPQRVVDIIKASILKRELLNW